MNKTFKDKTIKLFKNDTRLWNIEKEELNQTLLKDLVDKFDEKVIEVLLGDPETKKQFFVKVKDVYIFKPNDFKFFLDENKIDNSYTQLANKIGLTAEEISSAKVVLNWPFKDCVLEGGMTKEDEVDVYFKYNKDSGEWTEEKAKRKEIFFNEVLARDEIDRLEDPKTFSEWERFTVKGGEKVKEIKRDENGLIKENFVIKGNNLLALHSLKEQFEGKVKLIYIDPPYNTGTDSFGYNDSFNHSAWLTFMRNRLEIARSLLKNNGIICISIDDKEQAYLKVLCDEIFTRENFLNVITVKTSDPSGHKTVNPSPYSQAEYILMYAKNKKEYKYDIYYIPSEYDSGYNQYITNLEDNFSKWKIVNLNDFVAKELGYKDTKEANKKLGKAGFLGRVADFALQNKEKVFQPTAIADDAAKEIVEVRDISKNTENKIFKVQREKEDIYIRDGRQIYFYSKKVKMIDGELVPAKPLTNMWIDIPYNGIGSEGGVRLKNGKKPEKLLRRIIDISTKEDDIVLDYHAGSGTTCAVAHKMGRQWIGIEQLDYSENNPEERMKGVIAGDKTGISKETNWKGGGDFIYIQLAKWNEEAKEKITEIKSYDELVKLFGSLYEKYFLNYNVKAKDFKETVIKSEEFKKLSLIEQKKMFVRMLDLNQMYINFSERNDKKYNLSKDDIALSEKFYDEK